jgi:predicted ribonuclease YlaK
LPKHGASATRTRSCKYTLFDQVDWAKEVGTPAVVLVVPTAVLRALDRYKANRDHSRQQKRARQVLPLLSKYAFRVPPGVTGAVRRRVELLLRDREPPLPDDFDPSDSDDRIVADALDFRWRHPGAQVVVLSGDYTVRLKARIALAISHLRATVYQLCATLPEPAPQL